jgi:NhaP-type Na+/H+ or K+/H+ antiporter
MSKRLAAAMSLIVFAVCLLVGIQADNSFGTTIQRALLAMLGTLVVGLIIGAMAQKMLDENIKPAEEKDKNS